MAVKVAELAVDITVNGAAPAKNALKGVEDAGNSAANAMKTAFALVQGYFGVQTVKAVVTMAENWQLINARLGLYTKNASEAIQVQSQLLRVANETRSSLTDSAKLYTRIAANATELGATTEQILKVTKLVGQANQISGATTEEAAASAQQLAQALGSGKLAGDELRSILENSPRLARAIADGLGVSVGALKQMGKDGKLLSDTVFTALVSQSEKMAAEFAKIPPTLGGAFTVMMNSLSETIGGLNQKLGITQGLARGILALFGDDRIQLFFGEDPRSTQTNAFGVRSYNPYFANRGDIRRSVEANADFASRSQSNPLFGGNAGVASNGFGSFGQLFRPTLAQSLAEGYAGSGGGIDLTRGGAIGVPDAPGKKKSGARTRINNSGRPFGYAGSMFTGPLGAAIQGRKTGNIFQNGLTRGDDDKSSPFADLANKIGDDLKSSMQGVVDLASSIGSTLVDSISTGIATAVQSGSITEGLRALGGSLIGGVGALLVDFGKKMLLASSLMETLFKSLANFLPGGSITASIALIALGSVMVGLGQKAARSSFSGAGRSDGFSGGGFSIPTSVSSSSVFGAPSSIIADGRTPITSSGANVNAAAPMVVNVFSPDDPTTQRFFRETLRRADGRGAF